MADYSWPTSSPGVGAFVLICCAASFFYFPVDLLRSRLLATMPPIVTDERWDFRRPAAWPVAAGKKRFQDQKEHGTSFYRQEQSRHIVGSDSRAHGLPTAWTFYLRLCPRRLCKNSCGKQHTKATCVQLSTASHPMHTDDMQHAPCRTSRVHPTTHDTAMTDALPVVR